MAILSDITILTRYVSLFPSSSFHLQAVTLIKKQNMAAQVPATLKGIQPYLKITQEYDKRDAVVAYYCKFFFVFCCSSGKGGCNMPAWSSLRSQRVHGATRPPNTPGNRTRPPPEVKTKQKASYAETVTMKHVTNG